MGNLDEIFGLNGANYTNAEDFSKNSSNQYIRSQDELALYSGSGNGRVYTAYEAYRIFGMSVLEEVYQYGSAIITKKYDVVSTTIKQQIKYLGLSRDLIAQRTGLTINEIENI
jgi:hypothetical protein